VLFPLVPLKIGQINLVKKAAENIYLYVMKKHENFGVENQ
jgi:hypothetical protein